MTPSQARSLQTRLLSAEDITLELLTADWECDLPPQVLGLPCSNVDDAIELAITVRGGEAAYIILHKALIVARMKAIDLLQAAWFEYLAPTIVSEILQTFISTPEPRRFYSSSLDDLDI